MADELLRELSQIQQYATGLQGLLASAQAQAPPSSEGADRSGTIRVLLDADGQPNAFRVEPGWHRKLAAPDFGDAVIEAFQAAMGMRLAVWTKTLQERGWQADVDRLQVGSMDKQPSAAPSAQLPPVVRPIAQEMRPRSIDEIAEDVIKAFDNVKDTVLASPQGATGTGSSRSGKLVLTLSKTGLVSCNADPQWVSGQTAASLMNALGEALTAARADLAKNADQPAPSGSLDRLLAEALELLSNPRRVVDS